MSQLKLIKLVASREFFLRLKSKAFLGSMTITTLILLAIIIIPSLASDDGPSTVELGIVAGNAERLQAAIGQAPTEREVEFIEFESLSTATTGLRNGEVDAVLAADNDIIVNQGGFLDAYDVPTVVLIGAQVLNLQDASVNSGLSIQELAELTQTNLNVEILDEKDFDNVRTVIAYIGMMVTYMAILMFGAWTMTGVMEEKSSKVVETIVSTLRPRYLLAGKVIGIGGLAFVQIGTLFLTAALAVRITGVLDDVGGLPTDSLVMLAVWFVVGFAFYNTLFAATGALVNQIDDAQVANMPLSLIAVGSMMVSYAALNDADSTIARVATYVPLSAPFVVPIRFALESIAIWEVALALVVTIAFAVLAIIGAGRIYEGALLRSGGRIKLREAWRGDR